MKYLRKFIKFIFKSIFITIGILIVASILLGIALSSHKDVSNYASYWLIGTIVLFITIMKKGRKDMRYSAIPIAIVCCIIAYFFCSAMDEELWIGCVSESDQFGLMDTYSEYWRSIYVTDCAKCAIVAWLTTWFYLKLYRPVFKPIFEFIKRTYRKNFEIPKSNHQLDTQSYDCQGGE